MSKTDLSKILSIGGEQGLFLYVSQGKAGVIAESLITKKRNSYGLQSKVTALSDVSIYTQQEDEISLREVFMKMKDALGENPAPDQKSDSKILIKFFEGVLPDYNRDKFYVSHMKKVVYWYNILKEYASIDFVEPPKDDSPAEE